MRLGFEVNGAVLGGAAVAALVLLAILLNLPERASNEEEGPPRRDTVEAFLPEGNRPPAPNVTLLVRDDKALTLRDLGGKVLLVNFWATWCAPCVHEMPSLDRLQEMMRGHDFLVVPVSSDRAGAAVVEPFYREQGLSRLGIYLDPTGEATAAFEVRALPTSVVVDRDGRILGRLEGPAEWDSAAAQDLIRYYLAQPE